jgi:hypothetical protein
MTPIVSPAIDISFYYDTYSDMNHISLADIGQQIAQLEKELSKLYSKRVEALESELKQAQSRIGSFGSTSSQAIEAPVAKAPVAQPVKRKGKPARKPQQTAPAPAKAVEPVAEPIEEAPAAIPAKKARKPRTPKKRTRTPTAVVEQRIVGALKEAGAVGLSQIEVSKNTGLGYQTVVKKLKELPGVTKKGSLKEARFFLKA